MRDLVQATQKFSEKVTEIAAEKAEEFKKKSSKQYDYQTDDDGFSEFQFDNSRYDQKIEADQKELERKQAENMQKCEY